MTDTGAVPGRLAGRVAVVTGAARGLGAAEARLFVAEGAKVVLADVVDDLGRQLADELGADATYSHLDVGSPEGWCQTIVLTADRYGPPDILVNNAGVFSAGLLEDARLEEYERILRVNQCGVLLGMQAVIPSLKAKGGGAIVNTSSAGATLGAAKGGLYGSTKAAVIELTKIAALELGEYGIRVNAILPGPIDTPMLRAALPPAVLVRAAGSVPLRRLGLPEELARTALYLVTDESAYVTGALLAVDGGRNAGLPPASPPTQVAG